MTMQTRLVAYAPNGAMLGPLPTPTDYSVSVVYGDFGALSLTYDRRAVGSLWLDSACEVALQVRGPLGWVEPDDARYLILADDRDEVEPTEAPKYTGPSYGWRLSKALVDDGPTEQMKEGKRSLGAVSAGSIMSTFTAEAQSRGALAGMDFSSFSAATDSDGHAWTKTVNVAYDTGLDLAGVLRNLIDQGVCEARWKGRSLYLYDSESSAVDQTTGSDPIVLRRGRDIVEAPLRRTREALANVAIVRGDQGKRVRVTNPSAEAPWGDWEAAINQGGVSDDGTLLGLGQANLERVGETRAEHTHGLSFATAKWLPLIDYNPGDYVFSDRSGTPQRLRVRQVTLSRDNSGIVSGSVVLNDRLLEAEVALTRRVNGITGGSTVGGGSGAIPTPPEVEPDKTPPGAPNGVTVDSSVYFNSWGVPEASVSVSWVPTSDDVDVYRVYYRAALVAEWTFVTEVDGGVTQVMFSGLTAGADIVVGVSSLDEARNESERALSAVTTLARDETPPPIPSTPLAQARLGVASVTWDGKGSQGEPMPTDFDHVEVHASLASGFTPSDSTLVERLSGPGKAVMPDQAYGSTWWYVLIAVDNSGNKSAPSAQGSATTVPLVDTDLIGKMIDGTAHIEDGTIATEALAALAVTAGKIAANAITADKIDVGAVTAEKIAVGAITADKIAAGAITADKIGTGTLTANVTVSGRIATAMSGARVELSNSGLYAYNSLGQNTVAISSSGGATITGTFRTGFSGERIEIVPGAPHKMTFYGSTGVLSGSLSVGSGALWVEQGSSFLELGSDVAYMSSDSGYIQISNNECVLTGVTRTRVDGSFWAMSGANIGGGVSLWGAITCQSGNLTIGQGYKLNTDRIEATNTGFVRIEPSSNVVSLVTYYNTYTSSANMYVTSSGSYGRSTSIEAAKVNIDRSWGSSAPLEAIKGLTPTSYYDRGNAERYAALVGDPTNEALDMDAEFPRRLIGLIAEDVEALGLSDLVTYDDDGVLDGVAYDRIAVALIPWLREIDARLDALTTN